MKDPFDSIDIDAAFGVEARKEKEEWNYKKLSMWLSVIALIATIASCLWGFVGILIGIIGVVIALVAAGIIKF